MIAGIIALLFTAVGVGLVGVGVWVSLSDRKKERAKKGLQAEGASGDLEGLAKLAEALKDYPLGMQLIFAGIACMALGGGVGGIAAVA